MASALVAHRGSTVGAESSVSTGRDRNDRFLRFALRSIRLLNCSTSLIVLVLRFDQYRWPLVVTAAYAAVACWSIWLFTRGSKNGMVRSRLALADAGTAAVALVVVGMLSPEDAVSDWTNWSFAYGLAVVVVAGLVLRAVYAFCVALALSLLYLGTVVPSLGSAHASISNTVGNAFSFWAFTFFAFGTARHLNRTAAELDAAITQTLVAEADRARSEERVAQYRQLHDSVLATLIAIARGGLDHRAEEVRRRCAREAANLRRLLEGDVPAPPGTLAHALEEAIERGEELDLRISYSSSDLPESVPANVVAAFSGAVDEALVNVQRHAGVDTARITAATEDGEVVVRVVDQGCGFDPEAVQDGSGIAKSVVQRMHDVGGEATVTAWIGDGTYVELRWRR